MVEKARKLGNHDDNSPMDDRVSAVSKAMKLPETILPLCTIVIGHPAEKPQPKDKWKPENVAYNEFGGKDQ